MLSDSRLQSMVFAATVKIFNGSNLRPAEEDKNHLVPIILDVVAGSCPNKRVLSGTVAQRAGMFEGKSYLCKVEEIDANEYGRQFRFSTIIELNEPHHVLEAIDSLGMPNLIEVVENSPELSKSGKFTYPKGLNAEEKVKLNAMSAQEQDKYLEKHPELRTHHVQLN